MTFLNPAVLFGLIAASIPILIHLLNLRKLKKIQFSTLIFLKELQKNKIRKIKIKQWLLLALRILIIIFIVTAFARPTLEGVSIAGTASTAKTTAVFILDDTFSMEVVDAKGSYLNQAKSILRELIDQLQEGDDAALVLVSDISKNELKTSNNLASLKQELKDVHSSQVSGSLHHAVVKAARLLGESKNFNKELYILSDYQESRLIDENTFPDLSEYLEQKVKLYSFRFGEKNVFNLGIDNFEIKTRIFEKDKTINVSAYVTNYSNQVVDNLVVSLFLNKDRSAQKSISINPGETKEVILESIIKETGYIEVFVEIEDDEILTDNRRYSNIFVPETQEVLIISNNTSDSRFVEMAIKAGDGSNKIKIERKSGGQINSVDPSKYDAIIVFSYKDVKNHDRIFTYLSEGGRVLIIPSADAELPDIQKMCTYYKIPQPKQHIKYLSSPTAFKNIDYEHPLFTDIFENKEKRKIESPDIYNYFQIFTEGKGTSIISLPDNSSFLSEYLYGKGRILLLASAPVLSHSNFPVKSIFVPMMFKTVFYLGAKDRNNEYIIAGDDIILSAVKYPSKQVRVIKPGLIEEMINLTDNSESNFFRYSNTNLTGNYSFYSGERFNEFISVNANPQESKTKFLTPGEFDDYLDKIQFKGKHISLPIKENPVTLIQQARYGTELWKIFLIIALLLAAVEMAVARSSKKDLVEVEQT